MERFAAVVDARRAAAPAGQEDKGTDAAYLSIRLEEIVIVKNADALVAAAHGGGARGPGASASVKQRAAAAGPATTAAAHSAWNSVARFVGLD
ncbi:hypothetical protein ACP4OV_024100 [Aristida adscensionis]